MTHLQRSEWIEMDDHIVRVTREQLRFAMIHEMLMREYGWRQPEVLPAEFLCLLPTDAPLEILRANLMTWVLGGTVVRSDESQGTCEILVRTPDGSYTVRSNPQIGHRLTELRIRLAEEPRVPMTYAYGPILFRRVYTRRWWKVADDFLIGRGRGINTTRLNWQELPRKDHGFYAPLDLFICRKSPEGYAPILADFFEENDDLRNAVDPELSLFLRDPNKMVEWKTWKAEGEEARRRAREDIEDAWEDWRAEHEEE